MEHALIHSDYKIDPLVFDLNKYSDILNDIKAQEKEYQDIVNREHLLFKITPLSLIELFTLEVIVLHELGNGTYKNIREVLWESQSKKLSEERYRISNQSNSSYSLMFWLAQLVEVNMYLMSGFRYAIPYHRRVEMNFKEGYTFRGHLIRGLYSELENGDDFIDPLKYIFTVLPENIKNQISFSVTQEGKTIYEVERIRKKWLNALINLSESMGYSLIPYFADYRHQLIEFQNINFYIDFLSSELTKDILYPSKKVSPISCKKPIAMFKMFRFLNQKEILLIEKEETYKLVRILFKIESKYYPRYPLSIPKFKIPDPKIFSANIKSVFKLLLDKKMILGSKIGLARLLNHIFPYDGMSIHTIEESLKPKGHIHFNCFNRNDLLNAMGEKPVERQFDKKPMN